MVSVSASGKPSRYITNTKDSSALDPSGVGKSIEYRLAWLGLWRNVIYLCWMAGNTVRSYMALGWVSYEKRQSLRKNQGAFNQNKHSVAILFRRFKIESESMHEMEVELYKLPWPRYWYTECDDRLH